MPDKDEKFTLPISDEDFVRDLREIFELSDEDIIKLTQELRKKGHSFNSVNAADLLEVSIDTIDTYKSVTLYVNHLIHVHNLSLDDVKYQIMSLGIEQKKASAYITELKTISDEERNNLEILYQGSTTAREPYVSDVLYTHTYLQVEDEKGKFMGLAPNLRLKLELNTLDDAENAVYFQATLDELNQLIRRFQQIYFIAMEDVKRLKLESKVICVPEDDD